MESRGRVYTRVLEAQRDFKPAIVAVLVARNRAEQKKELGANRRTLTGAELADAVRAIAAKLAKLNFWKGDNENTNLLLISK